ncbi:unnamed protein product [Durusdinium trenchii]
MAMACARFVFAQTHLVAGEQPPVPTLDIALIVVDAIALILTQFEGLITPRCLDLWYILLQGLMISPFFFVLPRDVITLSNWTFVLRVMLALSARHVFLAVLGNATASILVMRLIGFDSRSALFTGEITKLTFLLLFVFSIRQLIFRDAKATVELKSRSIELEAVSCLLRGFCDAVVEVDEQLRIVENSQQLLTMLLRSSHSTDLAGRNFLSLFCSDDKPKVSDCLTSVSTSHTHALNARILDGDGNSVKVELLHIRFLTAEDCVHRLVGVREFQDVQDVVGAFGACELQENLRGTSDSVPAYAANVESAELHARDARETCRETRSTTETSTSDDPMILFDLGSFTILQANKPARQFCGKCAGAPVKFSKMSISDLSADLSFARLSNQIQDRVNANPEAAVHELDLGAILLLNRMQAKARIRAEYDPLLDAFVGTLFITPVPLPELTKANIDRLGHGSPGKKHQRRRRSWSSSSGSSSGSILNLHRAIAL